VDVAPAAMPGHLVAEERIHQVLGSYLKAYMLALRVRSETVVCIPVAARSNLRLWRAAVHLVEHWSMRLPESPRISSWAVLLAQVRNMILLVWLMAAEEPRYDMTVVESLELGILPAALEM
jgi:hypothetical protein